MAHYEFLRGVRVEVGRSGFSVISNSGKRVYFDADGNGINSFDSIEKENSKACPNHFDFMGNDNRNLVRSWYYRQNAQSTRQHSFLDTVGKAIQVIGYDYCIANMEPSCDEDGDLYYKEGEVVAHSFNSYQWMEKALQFSPDCESELATIYELFLWYAWRIAKGFWTLEYVCDDSSNMGNYCNSPYASDCIEPSGAREVGGKTDGIGNTYKLVLDGERFSLCGGYFGSTGMYCPVTEVFRKFAPYGPINNTSGVVVLKKI